MSKKNRGIVSKLGFSLLEMGVVLAAVSAITVAAVGGKAIVERSKLSAIISDIKGFSSAEDQFEKRYSGVPGDMASVSSLTRTNSGNANGSIDTAAEALQFWQDLALSGLIKGTYNGTSTNVTGLGVPAGPYKGSGYNVLNPTSLLFPSQAIIVEFAGFSSSSNSLPILTPEDAKAIDSRLDDGKPSTGIIRGSTDTGCISSLAYNVSNKSVACRLRFFLRQSGQANDSIGLNGVCKSPGATRRSSVAADVCPSGYVGKIMQTCQFDAAGQNGAWVSPTQKTSCEPIRCYGGAQYNDQRTIPCAANFTGTGIKQTCSAEGIWVNTSTNCTPSTTITCNTIGSIRPAQSCNWGQTGSLQQSCVASKWSVTNNTCSAITCSGSVVVGGRTITPTSGQTVGTVITNPSSPNTCGTNYTGTTNITCTMNGTWEVTSSACVPSYGSCTSSSPDTDFGCPPDQVGQNFMTCNNNTWTSKLDACKPRSASGERIGTARVIPDAKCPNNAAGIMIELAKIDSAQTTTGGSWAASTTHCAQVCPSSTSANGDSAGNATWPNAIAGASNVSGTCIAGYTGNPTRSCDSSNIWSSVTGPCTQITCPAYTSPTPLNNAFWPQTNSLTNDVKGQCNWPNYEGLPVASCDQTGAWVSTGSPCSTAGLPVNGGLQLWLDSSDYSTLYSDSSCSISSAVNGGVSCWKDKSGYARNATAGDAPTYKTNAQNGKPVLEFNGTSNYLTVSTSLLNSLSSDVTMFIIASTSLVKNSSIIDSYPDRASPRFNLHMPWSDNNIYWDAGNNNAGGEVTASWNAGYTGNYYVWSFSGSSALSNISITQNGTIIGTSAGSTSFNFGTSYNLDIGANRPSSFYKGNIGEILIYNRTLNQPENDRVNRYLANKWGIANVTLGMQLWLDASDDTTVFSDAGCSSIASANGSVSCWKDNSGHGNNAVAGNSPTFKTNIMNGLSGISFNGSTNYLSVANNSSIALTGDMTIFGVMNFTDYSGWQTFISKTNNNAPSSYDYYFNTSTGLPSFLRGNGSIASGVGGSVSPTAGVVNLVEVKSSGTNVYHYLNGNSNGNGIFSVTLNDTSNNMLIGTRADGFTRMKGTMGEIILYNKSLSLTENDAINSYLGNKWGITVKKYTPLAVSSNNRLWLDAADADTLFTGSDCTTGSYPANGANIGCWKDKSGNGTNATKSSNTPKLSTNAINGNSALLFDGVSSSLTMPEFTLPTSQTSIAVFAPSNPNDGAGEILSTTSNAGGRYQLLRYNASSMYCWNGRFYSVDLPVTTSPHVTTLRQSGSAVQFYWDGAPQGGGSNINNEAFKVSQIGALDVNNQNVMNGLISEIIIYSAALSNLQRLQVEQYLGNKWGVTITPPVSGQVLWLDASDSSTLFTGSNCSTGGNLSDGASFGCWKDKSGNAKNAIVSGTSPTYNVNVNVLNGMPAVKFTSGSSTQLAVPRVINDDWSIFLVMKTSATNGGNGQWYSGHGIFDAEVDGTTNDFGLTMESSGRILAGVGNGDTTISSGTGYNNGVGHVVTYTRARSGGAMALYVDGVNVANGTGPQNSQTASARITIGSIQTNTNYWSGNIGEILVYNSVLSSGNRLLAEEYLGTKWGITVP